MELGHNERPIDAQDLVWEQVKDSNCPQTPSTMKLASSTFSYNIHRFSIHAAPIDGEVQKVVPTPLQTPLSYHWHYAKLQGNTVEKRFYPSNCKEYSWLQLANNFYTTVRDCGKCAQNQPADKRRRFLKLFWAGSLLEFVEMDILAPLQKN